jgi:hypothetical protein
MGRILKGSHGGPVINGCEKEIQTHRRGTPPTRCFSSATPAIKKRMVRIPTKSYQMREIKSKQDGTQRLLRRDGWIALQAEER